MDIGSRLKEERERLGMNQSDFGAMAGIDRKSQFNYETGKRFPDAAYLSAVAVAGVDVLYVLTGAHGGVVLSDDESLLLRRYRASLPALRDAALRVLLGGGDPAPTSPRIVVHGTAGQVAEGSLVNRGAVNIKVGRGKGK